MQTPNLLGLVLAGGKSQRMGLDKSKMIYPNLSSLIQRDRTLKQMQDCGIQSYISCRADQVSSEDEPKNFIVDHATLEGGPGVGILSAHLKSPTNAWLVIACDFPWLDIKPIKELILSRKANGTSTAARNKSGIVEPLFAIWEPNTLELFLKRFQQGYKSPQKFLQETPTQFFDILDEKILKNINSLEQIEAHDDLRSALKKNLIK